MGIQRGSSRVYSTACTTAFLRRQLTRLHGRLLVHSLSAPRCAQQATEGRRLAELRCAPRSPPRVPWPGNDATSQSAASRLPTIKCAKLKELRGNWLERHDGPRSNKMQPVTTWTPSSSSSSSERTRRRFAATLRQHTYFLYPFQSIYFLVFTN